MESSSDRDWATKYLLDPLSAPEPSQETGPGSHFASMTAGSPSSTRRSSRKGKSASVTVSDLPTPPDSASPTRSSFHPSNPFASSGSPSIAGHSAAQTNSHRSRRSVDTTRSSRESRRLSSSPLPARFAGDNSMHPLDQLRKETKQAYRSPHLRQASIPHADVIDVLDRTSFGTPYHHEGPYDATLLVRNRDAKNSPVAATQGTNEEAIKATPRERVADSIAKHVPLQGTAIIPPGERGVNGQVMDYLEGADLQREADAPGGAYKRWPGMQYHPEDYKGKGESFLIERDLKERKQASHRRIVSDGNVAYEMQAPRRRPIATRQRSASGSHADVKRSMGSASTSRGNDMSYAAFEADLHRRNSIGHGVGAVLKKRLGGLRGKKEAHV